MLMFSTSQRMVYSILTRSREYSKAIHWTPFVSWRTTRGVVAGMGPGAAPEFVVGEEEVWGLLSSFMRGLTCEGVCC